MRVVPIPNASALPAVPQAGPLSLSVSAKHFSFEDKLIKHAKEVLRPAHICRAGFEGPLSLRRAGGTHRVELVSYRIGGRGRRP